MHWAFLLFWWVPQSLLLKNSPTALGCYQHTLLLWWYSAGDEQSWSHLNMMLGIKVHQTRWSCFLRVWETFRCFSANSKCVFMCLHWGEDWVWPNCHESQIGGVLHVYFCPSVGFSHLHIWSSSSTRVTISFLVTTLTKALLHQLLSLARMPALGRILVVSNFFH